VTVKTAERPLCEQLGETVRELVARADVKSLARVKAAELRGRVKDTTSQARRTVTAGAVRVRSQVADKTASAQQKATSAGAARKDQLRNRAAAVSAPVWQATPEQVRRAVTNGASGAKERWIPLTLAAGVLIVGCLALRQWMRSPCARASQSR
jgi:phage-related tail fiber protein